MTKELDFINMIGRLVIKYPGDFFNSVAIAQSCLETGFGVGDRKTRDQDPYLDGNNAFGYKAKANERKGDYLIVASPEEYKGAIRIVHSRFRKYLSVEESVKDHANMLSRSDWYKKHYAKAIHAKTPEEQCMALVGTYATDSKYGDKLIAIINKYGLKSWDNLNKKGNDSMKLRKPIQMITQANMGGSLPAKNVKYLVFHFVGAAGQARANGNYFLNVFRSASAHLFIDKNETVQVVPLDRQAWHVGDGNNRFGINNQNSIGVELCQDVTTGKDVWHWDFHPNTRQQAILVFADLMKKYNVPIDRVVRHYDASRKVCPGNWQYNNWAKWWLWKKDLEHFVKTGELVNSQTGEKTKVESEAKLTPKPTPDNKYTVVKGDTLWGIANKYKVSVQNLKDWNHINTNIISIGQKLIVKKPTEIVKEVQPKPSAPVKDVKPIEKQPEDKGEKTEAIELKEGQLKDWKGNVYQIIK